MDCSLAHHCSHRCFTSSSPRERNVSQHQQRESDQLSHPCLAWHLVRISVPGLNGSSSQRHMSATKVLSGKSCCSGAILAMPPDSYSGLTGPTGLSLNERGERQIFTFNGHLDIKKIASVQSPVKSEKKKKNTEKVWWVCNKLRFNMPFSSRRN